MEIRLADKADIGLWMGLVEQIRGNFPGLETQQALEDHRTTVLNFMEKGGAICAEEKGKILGELLFSREESALCFLAVSPAYRRRHAAKEMVLYMLDLLPPERDVTVTTYREGAPEGEAARKFYKSMGFREGKLTEEFGSPVQVFVLER